MSVEVNGSFSSFIQSIGSIGVQPITKTERNALSILHMRNSSKGSIQDAVNYLGIDNTWNQNVRESQGGTNLNYSHIAECLLTSTRNFIDCINTLGSKGGGAEAVVYGVIIDDRVIVAAEEKQEEFKKISNYEEEVLLHPNISAQEILVHMQEIKQYLSYNQIVRLLRIYGFSE